MTTSHSHNPATGREHARDTHDSAWFGPGAQGGGPYDTHGKLRPYTQSHAYDAAGTRIRKVVEQYIGGDWVHKSDVLYLGGFELQHTFSGTTLWTERETLHAHDGDRRLALVETKTLDDGDPVTTPTPLLRYQLDNHVRSATVATSATGAVISYEEFHPYGTTAYHAADNTLDDIPKRYRYSGKEKDAQTGLYYYYGARYLAPWLGRWVSTDPAGFVDGPNVYAFVKGRPRMGWDGDGRQEVDEEETGATEQSRAQAETIVSAGVTTTPDARREEALDSMLRFVPEGDTFVRSLLNDATEQMPTGMLQFLAANGLAVTTTAHLGQLVDATRLDLEGSGLFTQQHAESIRAALDGPREGLYVPQMNLVVMRHDAEADGPTSRGTASSLAKVLLHELGHAFHNFLSESQTSYLDGGGSPEAVRFPELALQDDIRNATAMATLAGRSWLNGRQYRWPDPSQQESAQREFFAEAFTAYYSPPLLPRFEAMFAAPTTVLALDAYHIRLGGSSRLEVDATSRGLYDFAWTNWLRLSGSSGGTPTLQR